jgi:hypothetical protein
MKRHSEGETEFERVREREEHRDHIYDHAGMHTPRADILHTQTHTAKE